jgi:hypothetical protein
VARCVLLLSAVLSAVFLLACGVQAPPRPPRVERPAAVTDLAALQVDQSLAIHFTLPQLATDGERLTKTLEIVLLYSVAPPGAAPSEVPPFSTWVDLPPDQWQKDVRGPELHYSASISVPQFHQWQGKVVVLAVMTSTRGFRDRPLESGISNLVYLPLIDVSKPIQGVSCQTTEKAIEVRWTFPGETITGQPVRNLTSYRVYRSLSGKPGTFDLAGEVASPPFADHPFEFGRTYFFKVRAVFEEGGKTAESGDSSVVEITPRDVFAPPAPVGLSGIYSAGAVELIWNANVESDLAGYNVYRRQDDQPFGKLNPELLRTPIFRDPNVERGHTYSYQVTAVDLAGNESKPSKPLQVEAR